MPDATPPSSKKPKSRKKLAGGAAVGGVVIGLVVWALSPKAEFHLEEEKITYLEKPGTLQIWCLDVDQASATLIVTPSRRHAILVDAGNEGSGRNVIVPLFEYLDAVNGVDPEQIDLMVVTHYDADHIGGADEVLTELPVVELFDHGDHDYWLRAKPSDAMSNYHAAKLATPIPLDFDRTIDGVRVQCLASNNGTRYDPSGSAFPPDHDDDNPNSVALLITYNGFDLYIAGDQTGETEARMVGRVPNVDVYHMNHHGSATHGSSTPEFLDSLDPEVAIASNGQNQTYQHPHTGPVNHLLSLGCRVMLMNFNEYSDVRMDPKYVSDDAPSGKDGTFVIVVDSQQGAYSILMYGLPIAEARFPIEVER